MSLQDKKNIDEKLEQSNGGVGKSSDGKVNANTESRKEKRLIILKLALYCGGAFYCTIVMVIVLLNVYGKEIEGTELTILLTVLGSSLTTIIGVIAGSSID